MTTTIRILRVTGIRSRRPSVLAFIDGHRVRWARAGWDCSCPDPACGHVDALADLLDERVFTGRRITPGRLTRADPADLRGVAS